MEEDQFKYLDDVNENLKCSICKSPFMDPQTCRPCDHTFCLACLKSLSPSFSSSCEGQYGNDGGNGGGKCPLDRTQIESYGPAPRVVQNLCNELQVQCLKCQWTGARSEFMAAHSESSSCVPISSGCDQQQLIECQEEIRQLWADNKWIKSQLAQLRRENQFLREELQKSSSTAPSSASNMFQNNTRSNADLVSVADLQPLLRLQESVWWDICHHMEATNERLHRQLFELQQSIIHQSHLTPHMPSGSNNKISSNSRNNHNNNSNHNNVNLNNRPKL
jgi:hypothetical protein